MARHSDPGDDLVIFCEQILDLDVQVRDPVRSHARVSRASAAPNSRPSPAWPRSTSLWSRLCLSTGRCDGWTQERAGAKEPMAVEPTPAEPSPQARRCATMKGGL
jgi:hypothetical protein